jgi:hypothetical protein
MDITTIFSPKNLKWITIFLLFAFLFKTCQSWNRSNDVTKLEKKVTYVQDSLTNKVKNLNDSIKNLNFEYKMAIERAKAAEDKAKAVQSTAEKVKANTTISIQQQSNEKKDNK